MTTRRAVSFVATFVLALAAVAPAAVLADEWEAEGAAAAEAASEHSQQPDYHDNDAIDDRGKIHVCKYVGQPGVDERLKDGKNPIEVNWNTLQPDIVSDASEVHIGLEWTDAHERSVVVAPGADCPEPEQPAEGSLTVTKVAAGDLAPDGASYLFTIDCGGEWVWADETLAAGQTWGPQTLPVGTDCAITETDDRGAEQVSWRIGDGTETTGSSTNVTIGTATTIAVTFTNHFGDDEQPPAEPEVQLLLAKEWTGDEIDDDGVTVSFTIDGTPHAPGDTLTVAPGTIVTISSETVDGLPDDCTSEATGLEHTTAAFDDWSTGEQDAGVRSETFTVTNVVDCEAVDGAVGAIDLDKEALVPLDDDGMRTVTLDDDGTVDVTYRYTITNTGEVDLDLASFSDDRIGDLLEELPTTSLPAGGDPIVVEVLATLTADDFDGEGDAHTNVAMVTTDQGPSDEAEETVVLVEVLDVVVTPPAPEQPVTPGERPVTPGERPVTPGERPVTPGEQPEVLGVVAQQSAQLPVTGPDSVLGMLIAALAALGLGAGLLKLQPATQVRRRGREEG
jgi:hypothetical protein